MLADVTSLQSRPWVCLLSAVCALDWYIVNLINRMVDLEEDMANQITETGFVHRNRRLLLTIVLPVLLTSLVVVHLLNSAITGLRIAGHMLAVCYSLSRFQVHGADGNPKLQT